MTIFKISHLCKRPGYWKVYHLSKKYNGKDKFKLLLGVCKKIGQPWKKSKKGAKPKFEPYEHAAIFIYMVLCVYSYRDMEDHILEVMDKTIDHSTIGKAAKRIPVEYMHTVLKLFFKMTDNLCRVKGVYIGDSTGISTDRYKTVKIVLGKRSKKQHIKWHIIVKYYPAKGIISIVSCCMAGEYSHDSPNFRKNFDPKLCKNGLFFGDGGFDAEENLRLCEKHNVTAIIRIRDPKSAKGIRRRYAWLFKNNQGLYRLIRGIIEGVFGGSETRYGNRIRYRLDHTRDIALIALGIKHNIDSYLRLIAYESVFKENKGISYIFIALFLVRIRVKFVKIRSGIGLKSKDSIKIHKF